MTEEEQDVTRRHFDIKIGQGMNKYYEDEDICNALIDRLEHSRGEQRQLMLRELCSFKTKAADDYWFEHSERYLPYVMICRSERFSDYCADKLKSFCETAAETKDGYDTAGEAYFILNSCLFKESDKLFSCYSYIARLARKLRSRHINWGVPGAAALERLPDFLGERLSLEMENESIESDFFSRLNDVIITTAANAIRLDKEEETVTEKVKELYGKHPEVYAAAGFYAHFVKDTSDAFDKFEWYTCDPIYYPPLLWVLGGLSYKEGGYIQNAPAAYLGKENRFVHIQTVIDNVDIRWFRFLCRKPFEDMERSSVKNPYYKREFINNFAFIVSALAGNEDSGRKEMCREFLMRAACETGSRAAFEGLAEHKFVSSSDELTALTEDICRNVIDGRCAYCFHDLFSVFNPENCDLQGICDAVELAADRLEGCADQPSGREERMWLRGFANRLAVVRHETVHTGGQGQYSAAKPGGGEANDRI